MTIIAGIDEAGYGPTLGPLIVAASAFRLGEGARESDLNRLVRLKADHGGLRIGDSKQLYHPGGSIRRIETTTLGHAVLGRGHLPLRLGALLAGAVDFDPDDVRALPWYGERLPAMPLPRRSDVDDILSRATRQQELLEDRGLTFLDFMVAPVEVPRFNRLTLAAGSKAWTLFYAAGRLIEEIVRRWPDEELIIHVDRHGGRTHYGDLLQTFFPLAPLTTVRERREESVYRLAWPGRSPVRIDFRVKADLTRAPVGLASIIAKTLRELFMGCFNEWFTGRVKDLSPTAGYPTDARRFLDALAAAPSRRLDLGQLDEGGRLVRCR